MIIGGTNFPIQPWPEIETIPAIKWPSRKLANGYRYGRDRGASEDVYKSRVLISDSPEVLNALQAVLKDNRQNISLSGFNSEEMIFGADVDYSVPITATVKDFGMRKNLYNDVIFDLELEFRIITKTLLATAPSLAGLRLQQGWEGDKSFDIVKRFSYNQTASYLDHETDAGLFRGRFLQTTEQMRAIRAYLLTVARANDIPFPNLFSEPFYPFGANEQAAQFQKCNVISWSDRQLKNNLWELEMVLAQAEPYFSAGIDEDDEEIDHLIAGNSGNPETHGTPGG